MPKVTILMPQLGESIAEATIVRLNIAVGDRVVRDQEIIEVETNKAVMDVTSLCAGEVVEIFVEEEMSYAVGTVLGVLEVSEEELENTGETSLDAPQATQTPQSPELSESGEEDSTLHFKALQVNLWVNSGSGKSPSV